MSGGNGASRYYVDAAGDKVFDFGVDDGDRVLTSISFTLTEFNIIERFETTDALGTGALNLTGNETAQIVSKPNPPSMKLPSTLPVSLSLKLDPSRFSIERNGRARHRRQKEVPVARLTVTPALENSSRGPSNRAIQG